MGKLYSKGNRVWIVNISKRGKWHVEGRATVVSNVEGTNLYKVQFKDSNQIYLRNIIADAQGNPFKYVGFLNKKLVDTLA